MRSQSREIELKATGAAADLAAPAHRDMNTTHREDAPAEAPARATGTSLQRRHPLEGLRDVHGRHSSIFHQRPIDKIWGAP